MTEVREGEAAAHQQGTVRAVCQALHVYGLGDETTRPRSPDYRLTNPSTQLPWSPLAFRAPRDRLSDGAARLSPCHSGGPCGPRAALTAGCRVRSRGGGRRAEVSLGNDL